MENYEIIAPNGKVFGKAPSWVTAVDEAVVLSLQWGVLFRVRRTSDAQLPFQKERSIVFQRATEYVEIARQSPKSIPTARAKKRFELAKRKLDQAMTAYFELQGTDFMERRQLSSPLKAHRTDVF